MLTQVSPLLYAWRTHTLAHTYRGTCVLVTLHLKSNYAHCTYATWAKQHCSQLAARCSRRCRALPFESYLAAGQTWCFSFSIFSFFFSFHFVSTQQTLTIFTLAAYPSSSPFSCHAICPSSIIRQTGRQAAVYLFDYHLNRHCRKTFCCAFSKTATPSV